MAVTFPVSYPSVKGFANITLKPRAIVGVTFSPFSGVQQVQPHQGQLWGLDATLPPMKRPDAEEWISFLLSLNGREGTFLGGDPNATTARGIATGTPQVQGAAQTGRVLLTDGWTPSTTGILLAGDYIQLGTGAGTHLHKNLKDVNSDGAGDASLDLWPALRVSPSDNDSIITSNTVGLFRLMNNEMDYNIGQAQIYGIIFSAVEAL